MKRIFAACVIIASMALGSTAAQAAKSIAVLDIELTGDTGGAAFEAEHAARLEAESERLRNDLRNTGLFNIVDLAPAHGVISRLQSQQRFLHECNGCDLEVGKVLNTEFTLVAWVDRVSGLILSLSYEIHDVRTGQIVTRKSYDFRGDNDPSWNHAVDYMVRHLKDELPDALK